MGFELSTVTEVSVNTLGTFSKAYCYTLQSFVLRGNLPGTGCARSHDRGRSSLIRLNNVFGLNLVMGK